MTAGGKLDRTTLLAVAASPGGNAGNRAAVAPRDSVEERIADLWRQVLGRDAPGVFDDFFTCGGHSLSVVRLLAAIRREFGRDLAIAALLRAPTIAQQAQLLRERSGAAGPSPLVLLRGEGSAAPLFCIHPVGGNVVCYVELARGLGSDRPIYGLQSPALEGGRHPAGIKEMAASYIAALREIQPSGPYHLAGWSLGGVIAFEMAQQLRLAGEAVPLLALIDSYTSALLDATEEQRIPAGDDMNAHLADAFARDLADIAGGTQVPSTAVFGGASSEEFSATSQKGRVFDVFKANSLAMRDYQPQPYDGSLMLCCASELGPADPTLGWGKLVRGKLSTYVLPGNHDSVLKAPQVKRLVEILNERLPSSRSVIGMNDEAAIHRSDSA